MKRFLPLRHYSSAPTTQGHLLDSFRWVEGARGHAGNCGHQFRHVPPILAWRIGLLKSSLLGRLRSGEGRRLRPGPHTEPAFRGFKPEARHVALPIALLSVSRLPPTPCRCYTSSPSSVGKPAV